MTHRALRLYAALACTPALAAAAHADDARLFAPAAFTLAQPEEDPAPSPGPPEGSRIAFTIGTTHAFRANFDDNTGKIGVTRAEAALTLSIPVAEHRWIDLGILYERSWYHFKDVSGFGPGVTEPWDDAHSLRLSPAYRVGLSAHWNYFLAAYIDSSSEDGADFSDSLTYGAIAGVGYKVNDNLELGLGVLVATRLEDDPWVIPLPRLDWKLADKLRLTLGGNRAGGALAWEASDSITLALEAAYRAREFRLEDANPAAPEGVARDRQVPLGLALTWRAAPNLSLDARAGYVLWHEYELLDRDGNRLVEKQADPSPYLGASLRLAF